PQPVPRKIRLPFLIVASALRASMVFKFGGGEMTIQFTFSVVLESSADRCKGVFHADQGYWEEDNPAITTHRYFTIADGRHSPFITRVFGHRYGAVKGKGSTSR
ncbi:MAG: hypothetical protein AB7Y74_15635, partial [Syntrophorhabdus sp.]